MGFWGIVKKSVRIGLVAIAILAIIYFVFVRSWILRMGLMDEEINISMPGDGLVASSGMSYTQAITINAPRENVWAYLVQVGYKRGGWYNWDFINGAFIKDYFYEKGKSADRVIPELQNLQQGDRIYLVPPLGLDVSELKWKENMLLTKNEGEKYSITWSYMLKEIDKNKTRLYVRWSGESSGGFVLRLLNLLLIEPGGAGIQQSQMLRGIKQRAESDFAKEPVKEALN